MARPLVRRQIISIPPLFPSSTSQTSSVSTVPPRTSSSSSSTGVSSSIGSPGISGPTPGFPSTLLPTSSSEPTPTLTPGPSMQPTAFPTSNGQVTSTETTSSAAPPATGTSGPKGNSFLKNKPLSGFVFGLAGLVALIVAIIAVTSYVRRRNRKRLLTDASNFSFDPKDVEDRTSSAEEKYSHPGHTGYHSSGHGHGEYALGTGSTGGFNAVGAGGVPRPTPTSPPISSYFAQDYAGHDGGYPSQYHNLGNVGIGYGATPNPYDMYGPRNGGGYPIGQVQYDQFYPPGPSGDHLLVTDHGAPVPRQLQPGVHSVQGQTFAPPSFTNSPQLNRSPPIPPTISPPPATLQPPASNRYDPPRLPTPDHHPGAFGQWKGSDDDAYGGATLSHDASPPGLRTLQVSNM